MAYNTASATLHRLLCRRRRVITSVTGDSHASPINFLLHTYSDFTAKRKLSTNAEWAADQPELAGVNAYDILGVSKTSSFAEIKTSFRQLAKETHPDLAHSHNSSSNDASNKFIQILAAYEILSDANKRAHYDRHLMSQRAFERHSKRDSTVYNYRSYKYPGKQMEVVEWLKWYRYTIHDILSERRVTAGTGYFDVLERDFYSAVHGAYYGPELDSMDLLPDCFEAEERSVDATSEVLHLVSGRDLFGMVCLANKCAELSNAQKNKLTASALGLPEFHDDMSRQFKFGATEHKDYQKQSIVSEYQSSDAYRDTEFHVSGRVVAVATRLPPKNRIATENDDCEDQIFVYLTSYEDSPGDSDPSVGSRTLLGVIKGLGTTPEEGTCDVYNSHGVKTHVIMKHRTLLVKHLHWYRVGDKVSVCECRCTRARLPPSKFWLFEPRSAMHDIGGWYVETYGRDKKGKTVPARRYWDGLDTDDYFGERLHPAIYLLALAYRTLDIEDMMRRKQTVKDKVKAKMSSVLDWYRKVA